MSALVVKIKRINWKRVLLATILLVVLGMVAFYGFIMLAWSLYRPPPETRAAGLADLDGDGDLDLFLANGKNEGPWHNTVWINQMGAQGGRAAQFKCDGQNIGSMEFNGLVLGDLDNDGDADALASNTFALSLFLNQGGKQGGQPGVFAAQGSTLSGGNFWGGYHPIALGDVNGDGLLDVFAANCCGGLAFGDEKPRILPPFGRVWFNQSNETSSAYRPFKLADPKMEGQGSMGIALGDLDGDGDLDAYQANAYRSFETDKTDLHNLPDTVWLNDGQGVFHDSGQRLGQSENKAVALGDLDGDGDLDAFVGGFNAPHMVWLNVGGLQAGKQGTFIDSGQRLENSGKYSYKQSVTLVDLDQDQDLDAIVIEGTTAEIWFNHGHGFFHRSSQSISYDHKYAVAAGDLDGDGDTDLIAGYLDKNVTVWLNDGRGHFAGLVKR